MTPALNHKLLMSSAKKKRKPTTDDYDSDASRNGVELLANDLPSNAVARQRPTNTHEQSGCSDLCRVRSCLMSDVV